MFEFLGMLVVGIVVWKIIKGLGSDAVKAHMSRSVSHAMSQGVPHAFASEMILEREAMKDAVAHIAKVNPDSRLKDAYEQNGDAIALLYLLVLKKQKENNNV